MSVYQRVKFTPKNRTFLNRDRPPSEGLPWAPRALAGPVEPGVYIGGDLRFHDFNGDPGTD